jgi:CBS domain-containing protein
MQDKRIKHVPVMQDERLVGIISRSDLIRTLASRPDASHGPLLCDDDVVRFKVIEVLMAILGASAWLTEVTVANGVVGLSGVVEDENVRDPSCRIIEKLPCVIRVDDQRAIMQPY